MAQGQPHAQTRHQREYHGEDAHVEGSNDIGIVSRECSAYHGAGIHDWQEVVGKGVVKALVLCIGGDIGQGDKEGELQQEDAKGCQQEGNLPEDAEVGMSRCVLGGRQARSDEADAHEPAHETYQGEHASGPAEADAVKQGSEHEGEDDASDATRRRRKPGGEASSCLEPMAHCRDAWGEDERRA